MSDSTHHFKGISHFVHAAETGTFSGAAEKLHLSVSAIAKSVSRLESRLGAPLFERTKRRLVLTDSGRAYYESCHRALAELAEAAAKLADPTGEPGGPLRLDVPASFGRACVMPALLKVLEHFPRLRPTVSFTDLYVDLAQARIDLAVRIGEPQRWSQSLGHRRIGMERLVFCAAPSYITRRGAPLSIEDLSHHDCIAYGKNDAVNPWRFATGLADREFRAPVFRLIVGDGEAQVAATRAGLGVAQLATWLVDEDLRDGRLVEVLPSHATEGQTICLVWPLVRYENPRLAAILDVFEKVLRDPAIDLGGRVKSAPPLSLAS